MDKFWEYFKSKWDKLQQEIFPFQQKRKIKVVVVTKYLDAQKTFFLAEKGIKDLGENRIQVLREKVDFFSQKSLVPCWHFIGHLQTNKVKYLGKIPGISLIHSIDSFKLIEELEKVGKKNGKIFQILVEINTSGEENKAGIPLKSKKNIDDLVNYILEKEWVKGKGFMTMAPFTQDEAVIRRCFKSLKELSLQYKDKGFEELSMGMSNDYKIALEEGATILRIGSYFYG